jgi:hypothetical protein
MYATVMPSLILVQNAVEYRKEHLEHHNLNFFTTRHDADAAFLAQLGFIPGRARSELWINLWMTICSPVFHFLFLRARLGSLVLRAKPLPAVIALAMLGLHAVLFTTYGWKVYAMAIAMPMFLLYHVSALLQFLTEHAWNVAGAPVKDWTEYTARCWGRFCGEPYPQCHDSGSNAGNALTDRLRYGVCVLRWAVRMICLHFTVRVSCLVSDLPVHDWHHLAHRAGQNPRDWRHSLYLREAAITNGDLPGFGSRELWGMRAMIEHQFIWLESIICHYALPGAELPATHRIGVSFNTGKPE